MKTKKVNLNEILEKISKLEARLDEIAPVSKRKFPSKKEQIKDIENNINIWNEKFPSVDPQFELAKMLDWLKANNKRKKDYKAFFRNWLRKASNSIGNNAGINHSYVLGVILKNVQRKHQNIKICTFFVKNATKKNQL